MDTATERTLERDSVGSEQSADVPTTDEGALGGGPTRRSWTKGRVAAWASWIVPILAWTAVSAYYYGNFVARPSAGAPGGADGVVYVWFFEWVEHSLAHLHNPLLSNGMNAPTGLNVMWNGSILLLSVPLAPLTAVFGPVVAVNIASIASPVLSAASAYFVFRRITGRVASSLVVATFYGFGPFFAGQNGHLHLIACGPLLPLILLVGYRIFVTQRGSPVWAGAWLGLLTVALLLVAEETAVMTALVSAIAVSFLAAVYYRQVAGKIKYATTSVGVGAGVAVVLAAYPLWYQFFGPLAMNGKLAVHHASLDLASFVRPSNLYYFTTSADVSANAKYFVPGVENTGYLGVPLLLVIIGSMIWLAAKRNLFALWWGLTALVVWSLSLGTRLQVNGDRTAVPGSWALFAHIKALHALVPARFSIFTALLVAVLMAWCLARLSGRAYAAATLAVAVALISLLPAGQYGGRMSVDTPAFFTGAAARSIPAGATVLVLPQPGSYPNPVGSAATAMFWQVRAHMRFNIIGGYGIFTNEGSWSYFAEIPSFARALNQAGATGVLPSPSSLPALRRSLAGSKTTHIVITDQVAYPAAAASAARTLTGCVPQRVTDVTLCVVPRG